ncbi:MAG: hypothetical protein A2383_00850 [Candidatus Pacebacteria bacterium RIFOXYB1_FULL_39_46]|nr:MAG: hypothetical protein A2182_00685 [Candidatus Pacebacteria bacterium RIFOXYA1_FULL_38_18]OGJ38131.1 MAG: hypothetical protein A2383_00850 [Candidatus Pacebacteria bacterium RIFOXYB1_FULL_39_46]OGJ39647.1 MAG: hypothetical protein A2411_02590 [Candidatus Pacebacteria bacterium RIFOXYC1_FULL_39_21]OGJ39883.1 MAG: hypothetical protein A2582_00615 [Candidatus Pacebacteria bacterium RIFOXYD1_FULL_39_27]
MSPFNLNDQLKKLQQRKDLLIIFLLFFVISIFWIAIDVLSSQQKTGISAEQRQLAKPLSPSLDSQVIEDLEQKIIYSESELRNFPIYVINPNQAVTMTQTTESADETTSQDQQITLPMELEGALNQLEEGL